MDWFWIIFVVNDNHCTRLETSSPAEITLAVGTKSVDYVCILK